MIMVMITTYSISLSFFLSLSLSLREGSVLSMVMVTTDAMACSSRILALTSNDDNDDDDDGSGGGGDDQGNMTATAARSKHHYPPSVVESVLDAVLKPLANSTKCASRFRADVTTVTDGAKDTHAGALVKLYNDMTTVLGETKQDMDDSVHQFMMQHKSIFDACCRSSFGVPDEQEEDRRESEDAGSPSSVEGWV